MSYFEPLAGVETTFVPGGRTGLITLPDEDFGGEITHHDALLGGLGVGGINSLFSLVVVRGIVPTLS
jgi:hypothetical protein